MSNKDPYGFNGTLSMEAFDMTGVDLSRAEDGHVVEDLVSAANAMEDIAGNLAATNTVSRDDALTMESICPGILPELTPVNSFTLQPTPTNLKVALESISNWRNMSIANMLKAVWRFISNIISWVVNKIKALFGKGAASPEEGKRVVANTKATVQAADELVTQTSANVDAKTVERYQDALEKAKLKVSDHFNHLLRDLINSPGTLSAINQLRSNIHTAYGKVDTLSSKFAAAVDLCKLESTYPDANNLLGDLAAFKPETLVELKEIAGIIDISKRTMQLKGDEQARSLRELCDRQRKKRSSWDIKTQDTVQGFLMLSDRVLELIEAVDDPQIGTDIPELKDFSDKAKGAPEPILQPLMDASQVMTKAFEVMQDTISIFVYIYEELISLVAAMWDASKTLMGAVATAAKQNSEVADLVIGVETRLKATLKKA